MPAALCVHGGEIAALFGKTKKGETRVLDPELRSVAAPRRRRPLPGRAGQSIAPSRMPSRETLSGTPRSSCAPDRMSAPAASVLALAGWSPCAAASSVRRRRHSERRGSGEAPSVRARDRRDAGAPVPLPPVTSTVRTSGGVTWCEALSHLVPRQLASSPLVGGSMEAPSGQPQRAEVDRAQPGRAARPCRPRPGSSRRRRRRRRRSSSARCRARDGALEREPALLLGAQDARGRGAPWPRESSRTSSSAFAPAGRAR